MPWAGGPPCTPPSTAFLEALQEAGVSVIFGNFGSDHPALLEAIAEARAHGRPIPQVITAPFEMVGLHAAHGYAAVSGKAQAGGGARGLRHPDAGRRHPQRLQGPRPGADLRRPAARHPGGRTQGQPQRVHHVAAGTCPTSAASCATTSSTRPSCAAGPTSSRWSCAPCSSPRATQGPRLPHRRARGDGREVQSR
ncbi:MAG: thiamine pyrophosphate-binding protein [Caulobacteraceae bacterium]